MGKLKLNKNILLIPNLRSRSRIQPFFAMSRLILITNVNISFSRIILRSVYYFSTKIITYYIKIRALHLIISLADLIKRLVGVKAFVAYVTLIKILLF